MRPAPTAPPLPVIRLVIALAVIDRAALDDWTRRLDELGVEHSPVRAAGYAEFVSVFDPDGIAWELWAAKPR